MENTFNMEYYKTNLMSPEAHPTDTRKAEPAKTEQESPPPANNKESLVKYTKATALTDGANNKKNIEPHPHRLHDKVQAKFSEISTTIAEPVIAILPKPKRIEAGQILITVFKARNIEKKGKFGRFGPYVRISLGRQEAK